MPIAWDPLCLEDKSINVICSEVTVRIILALKLSLHEPPLAIKKFKKIKPKFSIFSFYFYHHSAKLAALMNSLNRMFYVDAFCYV